MSEQGTGRLAALIAGLDDPARREESLRQLSDMKEAAVPAIPRLLSMFSTRVDQLQWSHAVRSALVSIGAAVVQPVLAALRHAQDTDVPLYLSVLTDLPDDATLGILQSALGDADGRLRTRAIRAMERRSYGDRALIPALLPCLHDRESEVRYAAAMALGRTGIDAIPFLSCLADSNLDEVAIAAIQALGEVRSHERDGSSHAVIDDLPRLLSVKASHRSPEVRLAAARAIRTIAESQMRRSVDACFEACVSDDDWLRAIVRLRDPPFEFAIAQEHEVRLVRFVADQTAPQDLRRASAALLMALASHHAPCRPQVVDTIKLALLDPDEPNRDVYLRAARRAGRISARLIPALLHHVRERDPGRCPAALRAIAATGIVNDEILDVLDSLHGDELSENIVALIEVLGELSFTSARSVGILVKHLNGWYAADVATLLGRLGADAEAAVPALADAAWRNESRDGHFASALASIGTPAAIEELRQMYREPIGNFHEWTVAEAALRSLGLGDGG